MNLVWNKEGWQESQVGKWQGTVWHAELTVGRAHAHSVVLIGVKDAIHTEAVELRRSPYTVATCKQVGVWRWLEAASYFDGNYGAVVLDEEAPELEKWFDDDRQF